MSDFRENSSFAKDFWEIHSYQISRKSIHWQPTFSMLTERRTNMTKLKVAFLNFSNAPKNEIKRNITANTSHTHCTAYGHTKFGTHLQNGDVIVDGGRVVTPVIIASYHTVRSSARSMVCGASSYRESVSWHPVHKKILKFVLRLVLTEQKITNFRQSLENCIIHIRKNKYICTYMYNKRPGLLSIYVSKKPE